MTELTAREQKKRIHDRWRRILKAFLPFAKRHRPQFLTSILFGLGVVGLRLALPWPIRSLLGPWLSADPAATEPMPTAEWYSDPWVVGVLLMAIVVGLGLFEFRQRVHVARFAIAWVRDIRADAFFAANRIDPRALQTTSGDLVARLVGDTARLKAGLKGTMTHVVTNGIFFLGVGILMLWISPLLGAIFLVAGVLVFFITLRGAEKLYLQYLRLRKKEGKLATRIEQAVYAGDQSASFTKVNYSSGKHETNVVRIQGRTTLTSHAVLGVATLIALVIGFQQLEAKAIDPGHMLIAFIYMIELHRPLVRLCRQGTRIGKMMACGNRLERILRAADNPKYALSELPALSKKVRLKAARLEDHGRIRLQAEDVRFYRRKCSVIIGAAGAGKTTALDVLSGQLELSEGKVLWDKLNLSKMSTLEMAKRIAYLTDQPQWPQQSLRSLLDLKDDQQAKSEVFELCGLQNWFAQLSNGLDSPVSASELSTQQRHGLALAKLLHQNADLVLWDDPFRHWSEPQVVAALKHLRNESRAIVLTAGTAPTLEGVSDLRLLQIEAGLLTEATAATPTQPDSAPPA